MPVTKEEFIKYLSDTASRETSYHNHKETIAWAAILLYFFLVVEVVKGICSRPALATGIIVGATIVVLCVLSIQYRLRKDAANLIGACFWLIARYLPEDDAVLQNLDLSVSPLQKEEKTKSPKCSYRPTGHYPFVLPKVLLETMEKTIEIGHGPRIFLEWISYLLVIVSAIISVIIIWW
jgi:hypothetical protein